MKLVVFSHKTCWPSAESPSGYATDGGFPLQMRAIAALFDSTELVLPCKKVGNGGIPLEGHHLRVRPLTELRGGGVANKLVFPFWLMRNLIRIVGAFRRADAVHAPIPGSVGTIGILLALLFRKPLFVRHCGNWRRPRSRAEHFWKWLMERFAGGRNVMLATGGDGVAPSAKNGNVKWVFSTSLAAEALAASRPRQPLADWQSPRLIIACRQEKEKGTIKVIEALPELVRSSPGVHLDVVGNGNYVTALKTRTSELGMGDRVTFRGHMPQPEVLDALRQGDLFCYPTSASEGFPKVVLEAMSTGLPIITTRVSVLPKLMESGAGLLLDDDSPSNVAQAVRDCLASPQRYVAMSTASAATAKSYSLERWGQFIGEELCRVWGPLQRDA
jgi:glycosyltransferase involved in cell wall biosynthesis